MKLRKIMDILFVAAMLGFIIMGTVLVLGQLACVLMLNGGLAAQLKAVLFKPACMVSATACMISFLMRYIEPKKDK